jgi:cytoskeletal protein RodZ
MADTDGSSIGCKLRLERLRRGKALDVVAAETKISCAILGAIENDQFDSLPGGAYRKGFVRLYARALGVDEEDAVAAFQRQHLELPVPLPQVPPEQPFRHLREVLFLLLVPLAVIGFYKVAGNESPERKHLAPDRRQEHVAQAPPAPAKASIPASSPAAESSPAAPVRAVFTMTEPVWVSVSCDGRPAYTGTLSEKESRSFEASAVVTVLIGNAGGLTITLNGQPLGPIGGHGEIQFLELTPNGTHRLPRSKKPPQTTDSEPAA